jgi:hypothetical protein
MVPLLAALGIRSLGFNALGLTIPPYAARTGRRSDRVGAPGSWFDPTGVAEDAVGFEPVSNSNSHAQSASEFNRSQVNSLRNGTGNFSGKTGICFEE